MGELKFDDSLVLIEKLRDDHGKLLPAFSCEKDDETEFLHKDALAHQRMRLSETYLLLNKSQEKILSYITLTIGSIKLSSELGAP